MAICTRADVEITIDVEPFQKLGLELGFTRGFTQSQAFDHRFAGPIWRIAMAELCNLLRDSACFSTIGKVEHLHPYPLSAGICRRSPGLQLFRFAFQLPEHRQPALFWSC
jgi:hypothetical protein